MNSIVLVMSFMNIVSTTFAAATTTPATPTPTATATATATTKFFVFILIFQYSLCIPFQELVVGDSKSCLARFR